MTKIFEIIDFKKDEPMSKHCSFKTGGVADYFFIPKDIEELKLILNWTKENKLSYFVLGSGTNILVKDGGIRGVVISLKRFKKEMSSKNFILKTSGNIKTKNVLEYAIENSLKGFNIMAGIPGTIGGAISVDAGTNLGNISEIIKTVKVLNDNEGEIKTEKKYKKGIILEATFNLKKGEKKTLLKEKNEALKIRKNSQPLNTLNAGCIFKNPKNGYPAGKMIDMLGLKNFSVGGAKISSVHANFITNFNNATSSDIINLIDIIKKKVEKNFNITLKEEVKIIGE